MGLERNERKKVKYRSNRVKNRRKLFLPREADGANGLRLDVISPVPRVPVDAAALWVRLVQRVRLVRLVQQVRRVQEERQEQQGQQARRVREERQEQLPRQYMHNKENAVTMRLSAH